MLDLNGSGLFTPERIQGIGPHEFRRDVQRLMSRLGFRVIDVDGSGDRGADLVCTKGEEVWIIQSKYKKSITGTCNDDALDQALNALHEFNAHHAIVASSGVPSKSMVERLSSLTATGISVGFWGLDSLRKFWHDAPESTVWSLRDYQSVAVTQIENDLELTGRALLFLATGLGKTVVAGEVIRRFINQYPDKNVLVLAHTVELIQQLMASLISMMPKRVNSQLLSGDDKPRLVTGLTVATNLSVLPYIEKGYAPDLVVVDECHHVGGDNTYAQVLASLSGEHRILGVTATPWRTDKFDIRNAFGPPSYECGIAEGMALGYLAEVDYRLFCDNIDWEQVPELSRNEYTIKDLNRKLFIPQRDEQIIAALLDAWTSTSRPRGVVFCQSISHAKYLHGFLSRYEFWQAAEILHSQLLRSDRMRVLADFRVGRCPLILAVDILNEGVDVPDVNIICFARVTHSRKIFMQQLGRGLRIADDKTHVLVLDFVADVRRMFELHELGRSIESEREEIQYDKQIIFTDERAITLIEKWIEDSGDLATAHDEYRLNFPETTAP